jgi:hypothetical protein
LPAQTSPTAMKPMSALNPRARRRMPTLPLVPGRS